MDTRLLFFLSTSFAAAACVLNTAGIPGETSGSGSGTTASSSMVASSGIGGLFATSTAETGTAGSGGNGGLGGTGSGAAGGSGGAGGSMCLAAEDCSNGLDDDCDKAIDCADPDCAMKSYCLADGYVDLQAPAGGDGSRTKPFNNLPAALAICTGMAKKILLFPGTYPVVSLPMNCTLIGTGQALTVIDGGGVNRCVDVPNGGFPGAGIQNMTLQNCAAMDGAGINVSGGTFHLSTATIENSAAQGRGGGMRALNSVIDLQVVLIQGGTSKLGGGIDLENTTATLAGVRLIGNTASQGGGGIYVDTNSTLTFDSGAIQVNNSSVNGAGVYQKSGLTTISHTLLSGNNAAAQGGAAYQAGGILTLTNDFVIKNGTQSSDGGAVFSAGGVLSITHLTIAGNVVPSGKIGAIRSTATAQTYNSIVWGNSSPSWFGGSYGNSDLQDGASGSNFNTDPVFVSVAADDYHLQPNSPCHDTGDPLHTLSDDFYGNKRSDGKPDVGAHELP